MREKEEIERDFHSSGRTSEGVQDRGMYFIVDILDNQKLLLEVLLDIRGMLDFNNKLCELIQKK